MGRIHTPIPPRLFQLLKNKIFKALCVLDTMGFSDWWYYTGTITKILVIAGIAAIITLALIVASPHGL